MSATALLRAELLQLIQTAHAAAGRPSGRDLGHRTGISKSSVARSLAGDRVLSRPALLNLAEALGADPATCGRLWDALEAEKSAARARERAEELAARPPKRCAVDGCPNKPHPTLCTTHQRHKQLYGDPTAGNFRPKVHAAGCSIEGCDRPYSTRGLCKMHDKRRRRAAGLA